MDETRTDDRYRAPALDKGLDILELLAATDGGLNQAEIAKRLGKSHNELYRMLNTLVRRGYVARDEGDRFSLTLKLFGLAHLHAPVRRMASYATPMMRELAQATQQANQLVVFDRGSVVLIAQQEAPSYWGISIRMGSHVSLFETGSGQVLLAFRPPEERLMMIAEHLKSSDEPTISPELALRLDEIRDRGYAMMPSIQIAGVMNLSAPVLRPDGRALAALTVPFVHLANVPAAPDMMETLRLIRATAGRLSQLAGANVAGSGS